MTLSLDSIPPMTASVPQVLLTCAIAWVIIVGFVHLLVLPWFARSPGRTPLNGLLWWIVRILSRVVHRATWAGRDHLPESDADHAGLIVVSNHTGAVDALLIQAGCPFFIRWMMASDMMGPQLDWLWELHEMIPVDRDGRDAGPLRAAIRHVQSGGAVGIFPEGRIVVPPGEVRPFSDGVGLVIAKTQAPVLLIWVSGTPDTNKTRASLTTPSHAHIEFIDLIRYNGERDRAAITQSLRQRISEVSGWPINDAKID